MASKTLVNKLDRLFSKYIRLRDSSGEYFTCCSCGRTLAIEQADAGHFVNRRWMSLRWNEQNVHAQCSSCNRFDEGNIPAYSLFMARKYGDKHIERLLIQKSTRKYTDFELELLIEEYKTKLKSLTLERSSAIL